VSQFRMVLFTALLFACAAGQCFAQFKTDLVNPQGATAPCVGIGPVGAPLAKKCVDLFARAGFIRQDELGYTGLTIGTTAENDGIIVAIAPQSPAALAGLEVGDRITAVAGKPVAPTPGLIAAKAVFGPSDEPLNLKIRRHGADLELSFLRDAQNAPDGPTASGFMVTVKPMINWRGQFAPCIGAGPAAMAAVEYCYGHFRPFGFIKARKYASTGFQLDLAREDKAIVSAVDPDSAAAKADVRAGDEIVAVNGQPLSASNGEAANELLFGKAGDRLRVTVQRIQSEITVELALALKPRD